MSRKLRLVSSCEICQKVLLISALIALVGPVLRAQEIHIRVLNGHNGKPIKNECLNIWIGPSYYKNLIAPTNSEGTVILHLERNEAWADAASPRACNGLATVGRKVLRNVVASIAISGDYYVPCQEYGKILPGDRPTPDLVQKLMPSYSIQKILESGVAASNTCGKIRATAKPGELIFFMRPRTFWERMRE